MAANGTGVTGIVRYLNERGLPTPIQYARANGLDGNFDFCFNGYLLIEQINKRYACAGLDVCIFISAGYAISGVELIVD